jgi:PPOX class probable F420-dependent enzyme
MGILPDSGPAAERLGREAVGWLTTVTADGLPQSSVVWFVVHDDLIYIQSEPHAAKLSNIRANPRASFHLNSDAHGGEVVTVDGDAEILDTSPTNVRETYLAKYERRIREQLQQSPGDMLADYNTTVRITPKRVRSW